MLNIRGIDIPIGSCVFLPMGGDVVRFGNAIKVERGNVHVSFPIARAGRREHDEVIDERHVLLPSEIESTSMDGGDRRRIRRISHDHATVFEVIAEDNSVGTVTLQPVALDGRIELVREPQPVDANELITVKTFASIVFWRFRQPVDPLVDVFQDPVGVTVQRRSVSGRLVVGDMAIPVMIDADFDGYRASFDLVAHYNIANLVSMIEPTILQDESLIPDDNSLDLWRAGVAVIGSNVGVSDGAYGGKILVVPRSTNYTLRSGEGSITREIYAGAPWQAWSHPIHYREPVPNAFALQMGLGASLNSVQFHWKGTRTTLYRPWFLDRTLDAGNDHLAVVRVGAPLSPGDKTVLGAFIGYCTGGRSRNVATELFDVHGKLEITIHDRGGPTLQRMAPIPTTHPSPYFYSYVVPQLSRILDAMAGWRARDTRSFDALFHHYAEGVESTYPVTRTLRLAVAFETFVNLVTQDFVENEPIIEGHFNVVRNALKDVIKQHLEPSGPLSATQRKRLDQKIDNLNTASNTRRQRAFWEAVRIDHSEDDDELLRRLRNHSVHRGYAGDDRTPEGLREATGDADRLTDLLNRSILTYAGYPGPVRSSIDGSWLDPITGVRFRVAPLKPGPEIEFTTMPPAMTADEQIAYDALRKVQWKSEEPHYVVDSALSPLTEEEDVAEFSR